MISRTSPSFAISRPRPAAAGELRRLDQIFLVTRELPLQPTLETIFESDCQKPADLFWQRFATAEAFLRGEELVRQLKKNFRGHLLDRVDDARLRTTSDLRRLLRVLEPRPG